MRKSTIDAFFVCVAILLLAAAIRFMLSEREVDRCLEHGGRMIRTASGDVCTNPEVVE